MKKTNGLEKRLRKMDQQLAELKKIHREELELKAALRDDQKDSKKLLKGHEALLREHKAFIKEHEAFIKEHDAWLREHHIRLGRHWDEIVRRSL